MYRYFFKISYDGTSYFGWQKQPKQISIQETIEKFRRFRFKNKISKQNILFTSKNKPFKNTEWTYLDFDIFNNNTIQYIADNLNKVYKKDLV